MIYVFDTNVLIDIFKHYYLDRFPSFWEKFDDLVMQKGVISAREVLNEIEQHSEDNLTKWAKERRTFFQDPSIEELNFIRQIYAIPHFQNNIRREELLKGKPVADPFVIAKAHIHQGTVVTMEKFTPNAARIPNICQKFGITCLNLEQFMAEKSWKF
jgi:hypothetical protein